MSFYLKESDPSCDTRGGASKDLLSGPKGNQIFHSATSCQFEQTYIYRCTFFRREKLPLALLARGSRGSG